MPKAPGDLRKNPVIMLQGSGPEPPINRVTDSLMTTEGVGLEIMCRANPRLVQAAQMSYIYSDCLKIDYVKGRVDQLMRLSISMGGDGRRDLIDSLQAGGQLPDSFYNGGGKSEGRRDYSYIREDNDE